ncbi:MAG: serine protease [Chloroflexota bacterium]|nr:serine protease [Chloroflexota bacterium]
MFQDAIRKAQQYTLPVVVSYRRQDGSTGSSIGAFIVLNEDGWILTACHIVSKMQKFANELTAYNDYVGKIASLDAAGTLSRAERKKKIRSFAKPPTNAVTNFSPWWGRDGWRVERFHLNPLADVAIVQIIGFNKELVSTYPVFKNPSVNFDVGENLCKLGFPFHNIKPTFVEDTSVFQLPPGALPIPLFPIEGIFTRTVIVEEGTDSAHFVETSSPGLRGQSGGPTFDAAGRVWAMQSRTVHYPLGFSPEVPNQRNREHQFLNSGMGTHTYTIIPLLKNFDVNFSMSQD